MKTKRFHVKTKSKLYFLRGKQLQNNKFVFDKWIKFDDMGASMKSVPSHKNNVEFLVYCHDNEWMNEFARRSGMGYLFGWPCPNIKFLFVFFSLLRRTGRDLLLTPSIWNWDV